MATQKSEKIILTNPIPEGRDGLQIVRYENYNDVVDDITSLYSASASPTVNTSYGLTAQGTSASTTSILSYDINVFTTVTLSDYATKLPQPVTGKSVVIVNRGVAPLYVYPSNPGGEINNLGIDQPAIVPPDGQGYSFYCIENPQPGQWVVTGLNGAQLQINPAQEITVNHTNGVETLVNGWSSFADGAYGPFYTGSGLGLNIPSGGTGPTSDFYVTGYTPLNPNRSAVAVKWQTNGTLSDGVTPPTATDLQGCELWYSIGRLTGPTNVQLLTFQGRIKFQSTNLAPSGYSLIGGNASSANITFNPGGPAYAGNIGDAGTMDVYIPFDNPVDFGFNGFSNVYFIFAIRILSAKPTGAYKFLPYVEYY